jgi:hypothetical protein
VEYVPAPQNILFTAQGGKIAAAVVRVTGLDERIAKASDMDAKDLHFGCSACPPGLLTEILLPGRKLGITGAISYIQHFFPSF